jgi:hypothetical protein
MHHDYSDNDFGFSLVVSHTKSDFSFLQLQIGTWDDELSMIETATAYIQPDLVATPVSEVESSCKGDDCPYVEWWLYDLPYLFDQTATKTGRTAHVFINMHDTYEGDGKCTGKILFA